MMDTIEHTYTDTDLARTELLNDLGLSFDDPVMTVDMNATAVIDESRDTLSVELPKLDSVHDLPDFDFNNYRPKGEPINKSSTTPTGIGVEELTSTIKDTIFDALYHVYNTSKQSLGQKDYNRKYRANGVLTDNPTDRQFNSYSEFIRYLKLIYPTRQNFTRHIEIKKLSDRNIPDYNSYSYDYGPIGNYMSYAGIRCNCNLLILKNELYIGPVNLDLLELCRQDKIIYFNASKLDEVNVLISGSVESKLFYVRRRSTAGIYELVYNPTRAVAVLKARATRKKRKFTKAPKIRNTFFGTFARKLNDEVTHKYHWLPVNDKKLHKELRVHSAYLKSYVYVSKRNGLTHGGRIIRLMEYLVSLYALLKSDPQFKPILSRIRQTKDYRADLSFLLWNWKLIRDTQYNLDIQDTAHEDTQIKTDFLITIAREIRELKITRMDYINYRKLKAIAADKDNDSK